MGNMNYLTETIRMFFAVTALVLVGLLSTPQIDLGITENSPPEKSASVIQNQKNQLNALVEKAKPFVGPTKPKAKSKSKSKAKVAEQKKAPKKVIVLKRS